MPPAAAPFRITVRAFDRITSDIAVMHDASLALSAAIPALGWSSVYLDAVWFLRQHRHRRQREIAGIVWC